MTPTPPRPTPLALAHVGLALHLLAGPACTSDDAATGASASATSTTADATTSAATASAATTSTSTSAASAGTMSESSSGSSDTATSTTGDSSTTDTTTGADAPAFDLPALTPVKDDHFATSPVCAECHANDPTATAMRDSADRPIAPFDLWQSTMMANSARDPFWWAMVAGEVATIPAAKGAIEAKCMRCHTPMAGVDAALDGDPDPAALDWLFKGDSRAAFGLDGVACAVCHQIQPTDLGADASFSGHFVIEAKQEMYGPHSATFTMPMVMHTGFTPLPGPQILDSALCGSCHTLHTSPLDEGGNTLPHQLVEQSPYLEWRASAYSTEVADPGPEAMSCQGCHLPTTSVDGVPIKTRIARRPPGGDFNQVLPRDPFGRHVLVGGNTLVPAILRDFAAELRPQASAAAFDATLAAARDQLEHRTATLELQVTRQGDDLQIAAALQNLAGHKLPSGFPSRRTWVRVEVRDAADNLVFRSGATDDAGRMVDRTGVLLASEAVAGPIQPHRLEITADDQVQIYEAIMADPDGQPTFRLLRGATYLKDNRLLPHGWKPADAQAMKIAPAGTAGDPDFLAAGDTARYRIQAPAAAGPYKVQVALVHQVLGARFAAELFALDAPAIRAFEKMYLVADRAPVVLAQDAVTAP